MTSSEPEVTPALVCCLARCGLVFISGAPPRSEDGTLLLYTGGCNAIVGMWRGATLRTWEGKRVKDPVDCWMRLPHPAIWPTVESVQTLVPTSDLFERENDVLTEIAREATEA